MLGLQLLEIAIMNWKGCISWNTGVVGNSTWYIMIAKLYMSHATFYVTFSFILVELNCTSSGARKTAVNVKLSLPWMHDDITLLHPIRFLVSGVMSANLKSQSVLVPVVINILAGFKSPTTTFKELKYVKALVASAKHFSFKLVGKWSLSMLIRPNNEWIS